MVSVSGAEGDAGTLVGSAELGETESAMPLSALLALWNSVFCSSEK